MNNHENTKKPVSPAPPINARKSPAVSGEGNKGYRSVYDEIAERRRLEKERAASIKAVKITDEPEEEEVKLYVPKKEEESGEIFSNSTHSVAEPDYGFPDSFDVYEPKEKTNLGIWITVIISLIVLCLGTVALYAYVNGYIDNIIAML